METGLAGAGAADHQHIFIDVVLGNLVAAYHDALGLRQEDILVKLRGNEGLNVLRRAP